MGRLGLVAAARSLAVGLLLGLLVSGGANLASAGPPAAPGAGSHPIGSTSNGPWTNLTPTPGNAPPEAVGAVLVNDTASGFDLWFGGSVGIGPSATGATWTYQSGIWTNRTGGLLVAPPARSFAAATFDSADGVVVLFGGLGDPSYLNDTWVWKNGSWTNATPYVGITPPARAEAAIDYDPAQAELLLFGGLGAAGPLGDTWVFSGGRWSHLSSPTGPGPACCAGMGFDSTHNRSILLLPSVSGSLSYTWAFSGGHWTNLSASPSPPARLWGSLVDDRAVGGLLLFGGSSLPQPPYWPLGDVWIFAGTVPHWIQAPTQNPQPEPRWGAVIAPVIPATPDGCFLLVGGGVTNGTDRLSGNVWSGCGNLTTWTQGGGNGSSGGPNPPHLTLTADRYSGTVPFRTNLSVAVSNGTAPFNLSVCTSLEGCTSTYPWSGIGVYNESSLFLTPGSYAISALVTDSAGLSASATISVQVDRISPLEAMPLVTPTTGTAPLLAGFQSSVSGGVPPYTIQWTFGDGFEKASAPGSNITHLYSVPGTYYPTLEILDGSGQSLNVTLPAIAVHPSGFGSHAPSGPSLLLEDLVPAIIVLNGLVVAGIIYMLRRRRLVEEADETLREVSEPARSEGSSPDPGESSQVDP